MPLIKALFPLWGNFPLWGKSPSRGKSPLKGKSTKVPLGGKVPPKGKSASNKGTFSPGGTFLFGRKVPFGGTLVSPLDPLGFLGGLLFPVGFYSERLFRGESLPTLGGLFLSGKLKLRLLVSFISSFISSSGREGEASWLTRPPHTLTRTIGL